MIYEIARILVRPGSAERFERAVSEALPLFSRAKGFRSIRLERSVDNPLRYILFVGWETLDDHIVRFRSTDDFCRWRALVSDFFAAPPLVDHTEILLGLPETRGGA